MHCSQTEEFGCCYLNAWFHLKLSASRHCRQAYVVGSWRNWTYRCNNLNSTYVHGEDQYTDHLKHHTKCAYTAITETVGDIAQYVL